MKKSLILLSVFFFFSISISAKNIFYVISPSAKLLQEPKMAGVGTQLQKGDAVTQIGEEGMFYKVDIDGKTGFVSKIFVRNTPPSDEKVSFGDQIDKSSSVKARARASAYTQTASARGLTSSEKMRTRGNARDYDFDAITWLESQKVTEEDLKEFNN